MTGDGVYVDDANFVAGKRGCTIYANVTGWVTCTDTDPTTSLSFFNKKTVSSINHVLLVVKFPF